MQSNNSLTHVTLAWLLVASVFALGIVVQLHGLLGTDMSWLMHATKRFLVGGSYSEDLYEINPPMVLYIHVVPVLLAKYFKISFIAAFRIYIFSLIFFSLVLCSILLQKIIRPTQTLLYVALMLVIALNEVLLPGMAFGQREHITTLLILPYLLSLTIFSMNRALDRKLSIFMSILAGIGFLIKPHFIFALIFCELYCLIRTKKYTRIFRAENIIILFIFILYGASLFIVTPDYFTLVPYIRDFYSLFFHTPFCWEMIFLNLKVFLVIGTVIFYFFTRKEIENKALATILLLSMLGFFISYAGEPLYLSYHTIPMITLSILLVTLLLIEYLIKLYGDQPFHPNNFSLDFLVFAAIGLVILSIPTYLIYGETKLVFVNKKNAFMNYLIPYTKNIKPGEKIYSLSTFPGLTYPLVDYAGLETASRYECLWTLINIYHLSTLNTAAASLAHDAQQKTLIKAVTEDIQKNKPTLVFVDNSIGWQENVYFNYLQFFLQSATFREVWKNYTYVASVKNITIYRRKVETL